MHAPASARRGTNPNAVSPDECAPAAQDRARRINGKGSLRRTKGKPVVPTRLGHSVAGVWCRSPPGGLKRRKTPPIRNAIKRAPERATEKRRVCGRFRGVMSGRRCRERVLPVQRRPVPSALSLTPAPPDAGPSGLPDLVLLGMDFLHFFLFNGAPPAWQKNPP